jgi:amino acid adenylation domain-containing protein
VTTFEFLSYLRNLDVKVWAEGDKLRYRAPESALSPSLRTELAERKPEILRVLSELEKGARPARPSLRPIARDSEAPLSFSQQRLWLLDRMEPGNAFYNESAVVRLRGRLDVPALERTISEIVRRHEALRTIFPAIDGRPIQVIQPAYFLSLSIDDLGALPEGEREDRIRRLIKAEVRRPFDLEKGPLIRAGLLRSSADEYTLVVTLHHIICDRWSMGALIREVGLLYQSFVSGDRSPLPELPVQYADYAYWQRQWMCGEELESQLSYWKRRLAGAPPALELPTDRPRPPARKLRGARLSAALGPELSRELENLSRERGVTLFMTLLAAFQTLLHRYTGQTDIVIGSPVAGRTMAEVEGLIGFFVNTLVLRADLSANPTYLALLDRVRDMALGAYAHQDLPFERLVEDLQPERDLSRTPLFQVMAVLQNAPMPPPELSGLDLNPLEVDHEVAKFDLTLFLTETAQGLRAEIEYDRDLFDTETISRALGHYRRLLEEVVVNPDRRLSDAPLLTEGERSQLLVEWNETERDYPRDWRLSQLLESQALRTPDAVAVVFERDCVTYQALNRRANQLAHRLRKLGVKPDARVALCVEPGLDLVVGLFAILKAGGAYVPLDPAYPIERLAYILEDSAPAAALTDPRVRIEIRSALVATGAPVIELGTDDGIWAGEPETDPDLIGAGLTSAHLAYVIYTSGSTGRPKGVMVEHRGIINLLCSMQNVVDAGPDDCVLALTTLAFDIAGLELYLPLARGSRIALAARAERNDPASLAETIAKSGVTIAQATPATWRMLLDSGWRGAVGLKALCGGEALSTELAGRISERVGKLWNVYGPTETTIWSSVSEIDRATPAEAPMYSSIGRPIDNTRIYLLDRNGQPVPIGITGEIYICAPGVARGYLNRPDLTAERFVANPFAGEPFARTYTRMYKTGDLARYLADGKIEFLGRNDFQVKLRGFRIELGEIEACLARHPGIREAVVVAREDSPGAMRLAAYYTKATTEDTVDAEALRAYLSTMLPDYMAPAAYVALDALPLTSNGKLDRQALPTPEAGAHAAREYEAPIGEIETTLARIWAEALKSESVGRQDNFFDLGGHSLLAVRVTSRVRQALGVEITLTELFARPTPAALARSVRNAARSALPPITITARDQALALSFAQWRLWFIAQMEDVSRAYHMSLGLRLTGNLDRQAARRALDRLVARHEALRATFVQVNGQPFQRIAPEDSGFTLEERDLVRRADAPEPEDELRRLMSQEVSQSFDLETGPLIRGCLVQLGETEHVLLITMHHIVSDGWSMGVLVRELSSLYRAYSRGQSDPLPPLTIQYADYAAWQRRWVAEDALQAQVDYWRRALAGAPELLALPTDRPRPARQDYAGAFIEIEMDERLTAGLKALSRRHGVTLFMTLLAAWATLLARLSGQDEVVIGTPVANRNRAEIEPLIGFFVNMLALRFDMSDGATVSQTLQRVKTRTLEAQERQDLPFEHLVEILRPSRTLARHPLFQTTFTWENDDEGEIELPGLTMGAVKAPQITTKFDLSLYLSEARGRIVGGLEYSTALFDPATIERYGGYLRNALDAMVADDRQAVDRLPLMNGSERHQLLVEWNTVDPGYSREYCIHALFEAQAADNPDAVAIVHGDSQLTYGELNARANRLAHHLRGLGVRPDARVALCVERGLEMVIGLLAILKAGGAYVPLDPVYPAERLAYLLEDSAPVVALTQAGVQPKIRSALSAAGRGVIDLPVIDLEDDSGRWDGESDADPDHASRWSAPGHLAYVIHTSGSTGQPKGVMVEHVNLTRLFSATAAWFNFDRADVWTLFHSFAFDFSVWEIWGALVHGARLIITPQITTRSPHEFYRLLCAAGVTILNQTPSAFRQLMAAQDESGQSHRLRHVILGGEALEVAMLKPWHQRGHNRRARITNMYGITETTVHVTYRPLDPSDSERAGNSPIGRRIPDLKIYLLDTHGQPVPVGATGEMYVGGAGVARGYLNRPELTAERFVADPASSTPGARMYKTGDLGRYLADGSIEYLGRNDQQVKIRGFRIELGEIEACLARHPDIREAVALAREDGSEDKRLVAYVTPRPFASGEEALRASHEQVMEWAAIYDQTYDHQAALAAETGFNVIGWNSSYTRSPIPAQEMRDWLDGVLARVRDLRPNRVLEVGCGSGMILFNIAPECELYVGTELSKKAIDQLEGRIVASPALQARTRLIHSQAADFSSVPDQDYDTVILNSVVQYFPSIEYLLEVIEEAIGRIGSSGHIFIGDVRHYGLLEAFHLSVQLYQSSAELGMSQLAWRVAQKVRTEPELLIDPAWFFSLQERISEIRRVQVIPKEAKYENEMSAYRYDVVLSVGVGSAEADSTREIRPGVLWIDCKREARSWGEIKDRIAVAGQPVVALRSIANPRVAKGIAALGYLKDGEFSGTAAELRALAAAESEEGVTREELATYSAEQGYSAQFSWFPNEEQGEYQALLTKNGCHAEVDWRGMAGLGELGREHASYANAPLHARRLAALPERLRIYLSALLPEHMRPAAYVTLDEMPLTENGKLDRRALPAPEGAAFASGEYEAPVGEIETALAEIWADALKLERVSRNDDFFALGGHSLLATKLIARIRREMGVEIAIQDLFMKPTFAALAEQVVNSLLAELTAADLEDFAGSAKM